MKHPKDVSSTLEMSRTLVIRNESSRKISKIPAQFASKLMSSFNFLKSLTRQDIERLISEFDFISHEMKCAVKRNIVDSYHLQENPYTNPKLALCEMLMRLMLELLSRKIHVRVLSCYKWQQAVRDSYHQKRMMLLVDSVYTNHDAYALAKTIEWLHV